jgi:hypothetical protein
MTRNESFVKPNGRTLSGVGGVASFASPFELYSNLSWLLGVAGPSGAWLLIPLDLVPYFLGTHREPKQERFDWKAE